MPRLIATLAAAGLLLSAVEVRADAPVVVWMADGPSGMDCASALAVELAARGAQVLAAPVPPGAGPSTRSRVAHGTAVARNADVALWLEAEADGSRSVRAVGAAGGPAVWAPVPAGETHPRVIALIAVSLIDELLAAPDPEPVRAVLTVRVGRDLAAPPPSTEEASTAEARPSPAARPRAVLAEPLAAPRSAQRRDFHFEVAPLFAGVAAGLGVGLGAYPVPWLRLGLHGRVSYVYLADVTGAALTGSIAWVSDDDDGRVELGAEGGLVVAESNALDAGGMVVGLAGLSWGPWPDVRMGIRLSGGVAILEGAPTPTGILDLYLQVMP